MNTRGLVELVILTVGLQYGVINDKVFAMMVIMALVTTFMTTPLLHWVYPSTLLEKSAPASGSPAADEDVHVASSPSPRPRSSGPLLQIADLLSGTASQRKLIASLPSAAARSIGIPQRIARISASVDRRLAGGARG